MPRVKGHLRYDDEFVTQKPTRTALGRMPRIPPVYDSIRIVSTNPYVYRLFRTQCPLRYHDAFVTHIWRKRQSVRDEAVVTHIGSKWQCCTCNECLIGICGNYCASFAAITVSRPRLFGQRVEVSTCLKQHDARLSQHDSYMTHESNSIMLDSNIRVTAFHDS